MTVAAAHGLAATSPQGWEVRIFKRPDGGATLHAGSFPLPVDDGEYGAAATSQMGGDDAFVALTEFRVDERLQPGRGLFAAARPSQLPFDAFSPAALQRARPGQLGVQLFFTVSGRPFCLYAVLGSTHARRRLPELDALLRSLSV